MADIVESDISMCIAYISSYSVGRIEQFLFCTPINCYRHSIIELPYVCELPTFRVTLSTGYEARIGSLANIEGLNSSAMSYRLKLVRNDRTKR